MHRNWRNTFNFEENVKSKPLLSASWYCRVCRWAVGAAKKHHKRTRICTGGVLNTTTGGAILHESQTENAPAQYWGKTVRGPVRKAIYYVKDGILRAIPDMFTFIALHQKEADIIRLKDEEFNRYTKGPPMKQVIPAEEAFHNKERLSQD